MGKTRLPISDGAHSLRSAGCDELVPRDSRVIWAWFPRYSKAMLMVYCDYLYAIAMLRTFLHTLQCRNAGLPEHLHSGIPALPIHGGIGHLERNEGWTNREQRVKQGWKVWCQW